MQTKVTGSNNYMLKLLKHDYGLVYTLHHILVASSAISTIPIIPLSKFEIAFDASKMRRIKQAVAKPARQFDHAIY